MRACLALGEREDGESGRFLSFSDGLIFTPPSPRPEREREENINAHTRLLACLPRPFPHFPRLIDRRISLPNSLSLSPSVENALRRAAAVSFFVFLVVFASYVNRASQNAAYFRQKAVGEKW